jgi:hypothetical protein
MKNSILAVVVLTCCSAASAIPLTGFGTGQFSDQGSSGFAQTATTATFSGSDQTGVFLGTFAPVNISSVASGIQLELTATLTTANTSSFVFELFDGSNFQGFTGSWASFTPNVASTVVLPISATLTPSFNYSTVQGAQILFGGTGNSLTVQFDNLQAVVAPIPEPSSFAALAGFAALGLVGLRRRRR